MKAIEITYPYHVQKRNHEIEYGAVKDRTSLDKLLEESCKSGNITPNKSIDFFDYMIHMRPTPPMLPFNIFSVHLLRTCCFASQEIELKVQHTERFNCHGNGATRWWWFWGGGPVGRLWYDNGSLGLCTWALYSWRINDNLVFELPSSVNLAFVIFSRTQLWNISKFLGSGCCATVVPCHRCIQPLNPLGWMESIKIQQLEATVTQYHNCTTVFPKFLTTN